MCLKIDTQPENLCLHDWFSSSINTEVIIYHFTSEKKISNLLGWGGTRVQSTTSHSQFIAGIFAILDRQN